MARFGAPGGAGRPAIRRWGHWSSRSAARAQRIDPSEKAVAESLLRSLLIGRGTYGLRFRAGVGLLLWHADARDPLEVEFTVGGPWRGLDGAGCVAFAEFVGRSRFLDVVAVRLSHDADLTLTFADGHRLTASALDEHESWDVSRGPYKVLSLPGRGVGWWTNLDHRST